MPKRRECTLCAKEIVPRLQQEVVALRMRYYEDYVRDVGEPIRRDHLWCTACTRPFIEWLASRASELGTDDD